MMAILGPDSEMKGRANLSESQATLADPAVNHAMTQRIDSAKLKTVAERLEWMLKQYPDGEDVQGLLHSLAPLLEDAKVGRVTEPLDSMKIPGAWNFSDGRYIPYGDPGVDSAYVAFVVEMEGGLSKQEKQLNARMDALRKAGSKGPDHE